MTENLIKTVLGDIILTDGKVYVAIGMSIQDGETTMLAERNKGSIGHYVSYTSKILTKDNSTFGKRDVDISHEDYEFLLSADHALVMLYF